MKVSTKLFKLKDLVNNMKNRRNHNYAGMRGAYGRFNKLSQFIISKY